MILRRGLPLPKSPSAQMAEQGADPTEQEREARGWWSLRFQHDSILRKTRTVRALDTTIFCLQLRTDRSAHAKVTD
jgi:hypothetical protein